MPISPAAVAPAATPAAERRAPGPMPARATPFPAGRPIPCCVQVTDALVQPARHGLEVLLTGLGLEPAWVGAGGLSDGGIYYGDHPETVGARSVRLRSDPTLGSGSWPSLQASLVSSLDWDGTRWPLLYPANRAFGEPTGSIEDADVVASAHAWTTGRLEQQVRRRDQHGRLRDGDAPTAVVAEGRPDLADASRRPAVEAYRSWLAGALARVGIRSPGRTWGGRSWAVIPTVDVDLIRTRRPFGANRPDPRKRLLADLAQRLTKDGGSATVFLKAGATAKYDVAYDLAHAALAPIWDGFRDGALEVGLHPSYFAHDHPHRFTSEYARLRAAAATSAHRDIEPVVRMHYLRWHEPGTLNAITAAGAFSIDSTIGFNARAGFRRATAVPYRLYDLHRDRPLDIWEAPLSIMDTALFVHGKSDDAATEIRETLAGARQAGGACVLVWHNEPRGAHVAAALDETLANAVAEGARIGGLARTIADWRLGDA